MRRCLACDVRTIERLVAEDAQRTGPNVACCATCQSDVDRLLLVAAFARATVWHRNF